MARILSTLSCVLLVVVRPFSRLGGPSAFLVLSLKDLVFSVQGDLTQQIEVTVLNITSALAGIGISTLAKYLTTLPSQGSPTFCLIPWLSLTSIAFIAGWVKSRLPRLHLSARISCFVSVWILTENLGVPSRVLPDAGNFLWITLTSAAVCLILSIVVLHWSSTRLIDEVSATLRDLHKCLSISMGGTFTRISAQQTNELQHLHADLIRRSVSLNQLYSQTAFELRMGRVDVSLLEPLLRVIEHLRREIYWGMYPRDTSGVPASKDAHCSPFQTSAVELGRVILTSLEAVDKLVLTAYTHMSFRRLPLTEERNAVVSAAINLNVAWHKVQENLRGVIHRASENGTTLPPELHRQCLFATSLLQMAYDTNHVLQISQRIAARYDASDHRLWFPRLSLQWLDVAPRTFLIDEYSTPVLQEPSEPTPTLPDDQLTQDMASFEEPSIAVAREKGSHTTNLPRPPPTSKYTPFILTRFGHRFFTRKWNHRWTLRVRLAASKIIINVKRSSHVHHAVKNAIGMAILSIPAFLPSDSSGFRWFTEFHGQWMIISYVWVLETNTGATWRVGYLRLLGTILGAIYAYITSLVCGQNPYALVVMVTMFDIPVSWLILKSNVPSLGVVASVTLPPIALGGYVAPQSSYSTLDLAIIRAACIAIGIVSALTINSLVFPLHSRVLFLDQISRAFGLLNQLYLELDRGLLFRTIHVLTPSDKRKMLKLEFRIRDTIYRCGSLLVAMNDELSLAPKPMRHYRQVVHKLQKILDLMTGLRNIRENIPRKETTTSALKERHEFISCVCISLFAIEHVFRARQPLPQFIPSARQALEALVSQMETHLQENKTAVTLSVLYSLAEREVMKDMVDTLEDLLEISQQLFGTSVWLMQTFPEVNSEGAPSTPGFPGNAWYNSLGRV
ncbi:Fusaric acid resistance protein family-domain-containing protein [Phlebopus sp. FC_14]|nr:Fusaric acid resistance protein family-domain-containing protein [Phlebopus sp. FC_14]